MSKKQRTNIQNWATNLTNKEVEDKANSLIDAIEDFVKTPKELKTGTWSEFLFYVIEDGGFLYNDRFVNPLVASKAIDMCCLVFDKQVEHQGMNCLRYVLL